MLRGCWMEATSCYIVISISKKLRHGCSVRKKFVASLTLTKFYIEMGGFLMISKRRRVGVSCCDKHALLSLLRLLASSLKWLV